MQLPIATDPSAWPGGGLCKRRGTISTGGRWKMKEVGGVSLCILWTAGWGKGGAEGRRWKLQVETLPGSGLAGKTWGLRSRVLQLLQMIHVNR